MKQLKPWVAGVGLCLSAGAASAVEVLLDFETAPLVDPGIGNFYLASGVRFEVAQSTSDPITTVRAFARLQNSLDFGNLHANTPSGELAMSSSGGVSSTQETYAVMYYEAGIDLSKLSFYYSSEQLGRVEAWGVDSSGVATELSQFALTKQAKNGCSDATGDRRFCNWSQVTWATMASSGIGIATSLRFYNDLRTDTDTLYDNIAFQSGPAIPEPSTYALMALGLAGIGAFLRRRRQ